MKFAQIAGQKEIINRIVHNVKAGRISHAQLIAGSEGSGSLPLALAYAQFVNCTDKQYFDDESPIVGDSCGNCPSCLKSHRMVHPDIHFVVPVNETKQSKKRITRDYLPQWRQFITERSPYSTLNQWYEFIEMEKQGIISAEECNEILNTLNYKSYESEYKVMIIWMIEKLFYSAAPKILKILEEPPEKTLFLLVSEQPHQILDTILSRVQLIKLSRLTTSEIADYLSLVYGVGHNTAVRLSDKFDRNISAVIETFKNEDETVEFMNWFIEWMRICFRQNTQQILNIANDFRNLGREKQKQYLHFVISQVRNAWVQQYSGRLKHLYDPTQEEFYENFGKYLNGSNILLISKELESALYAVERNANQRMLMTDVSMKIGNYLRLK
jgi:DNA polymerase III subunit delta'